MFPKLFSGKTYTREGLMTDAQWLLLLLGALQIQLALVIAILNHAFIFESLVFSGIGLFFTLLSLIPNYWGRFLAMLIWTVAISADFYMRHNIFSVFFIFAGLTTVYRMIRFHKKADA